MSLQMVFAYGGIEIIGITWGSERPGEIIPRAINSVRPYRGTFYVGTLFVIVIYLSVNQVGTNGSPFVRRSNMGITFAASILNFVVLTASLSLSTPMCVWRRPYAAWYGGAGERAENFAKTSPWYSVGHCTGVALLFCSFTLNFIMPENVFTVICLAGDVCDGMGMDMILLSPSSVVVYRRKG